MKSGNASYHGTSQKTTGGHVFPSDLSIKGMLHLKVLRANRPHAIIKMIDTTGAKRIPGVVVVLTHADIPGRNGFGLVNSDQPVLCKEKIRFSGDAIAVVAAESEEIATQGLQAINIEYLDIPAVLDPRRALDEDAPKVHESGNLCFETKLGFGDVERAFGRSTLISRVSYCTGAQEHAYLETETGISYIDSESRIAVVCGGQNPFSDRQQLAEILALREDQIWVKHPSMGGAFGGKEELSVQAYIALVTLLTNRPAKLTYTRRESIAYSTKRHRFFVEVEVGSDDKGVLTGFRAKLLSDTGAYTTLGPPVMIFAAEHAAGPYRFEASQIEGKAVFTNSYNASAFRGFGGPQVALGIEQAMDDLAARLNMDPIDFRLRNTLVGGERAGAGQRVAEHFSFDALAEQAKKSKLHRPIEKHGPVIYSTGVAFAWQAFGLGEGVEPGATVKMSRGSQGNLTLALSQPDLGEGNHRAFLLIAASRLGCHINAIQLEHGSTDEPNSWATTASRSIAVTGSAVMLAADALRSRIDNGEVGSLEAEAHFCPRFPASIEVGAPRVGYTCGILVTRIRLDTELGTVGVDDADFIVDAGKVISGKGVVGQIHGAIAQGIGFALTEELGIEGGIIQNDCLGKYGVPRSRDMPERLRVSVLQSFESSNPLGAKGVGEVGLAPVAAAISNALAQCTGVRFAEYPLLPERVYQVLSSNVWKGGGR